MAPAQFLLLYRQCTSVCTANPVPLDPERFMNTQIQLLLHGLVCQEPHAGHRAASP